MPKLVAFTGPAGCGKSTAAEKLVSLGWMRVKFAGPLKAMAAELGLNDEQIEGALKEVPIPHMGGVTPRRIMQTLGTEWGRKTIHPDLWVNIARERILTLMDCGMDVVVDDCRFDNEAAMIRELGGTVCKITGRSREIEAHESEHGVKTFCAIRNDGSLENLVDRIAYVFHDVRS